MVTTTIEEKIAKAIKNKFDTDSVKDLIRGNSFHTILKIISENNDSLLNTDEVIKLCEKVMELTKEYPMEFKGSTASILNINLKEQKEQNFKIHSNGKYIFVSGNKKFWIFLHTIGRMKKISIQDETHPLRQFIKNCGNKFPVNPYSLEDSFKWDETKEDYEYWNIIFTDYSNVCLLADFFESLPNKIKFSLTTKFGYEKAVKVFNEIKKLRQSNKHHMLIATEFDISETEVMFMYGLKYEEEER